MKVERQKIYNDPNEVWDIINTSKINMITQGYEVPIVITMNGTYEVLHVGHITALRRASELYFNSILVVSVNSDAYIRDTKNRPPFMSQQDRMLIISSLEFVDFAVPQDRTCASYIIETIKPDVHCVSSEYKDNIAEMNSINKVGAKLTLIERSEGYSSSEFIERIKK